MDFPQVTEDYIRESSKNSSGLPISEKTLRLTLLASEEDRRHLQDQNLVLQERLRASHNMFQSSKMEASMNAQGLKRCIQEKEAAVAKFAVMEKYCAKLDRECMLFVRDLEKAMESCDKLEKENNELQAQLQDNSSLQALSTEVKSLQEDKKNLLTNLERAEMQERVLFEERRSLQHMNNKLRRKLQSEKERRESDDNLSASGSSARVRDSTKTC